MANDPINPKIEDWIRLNIRYGGDFQTRLEYRLIWDDKENRLMWKQVPVITLDNGKTVRLPDRTVQEFAREESMDWYDAQRPTINTLFALGTAEAIRENAALLEATYSDRWAANWLKKRSEIYRVDEGLYRKYRSEKLKKLAINDGYDRISGIITQGIRNNLNPAAVTREIREKVFGLSPGEMNKSLTARADMIMRTELKYSKKLVIEDQIRNDKRILGVRIRFYGGPCPSNICINILKTGRDFKMEGAEAVADFWYDDGGPPLPPYHPRCHCAETRYLYAVDWYGRSDKDASAELPEKAPRPYEIGDREEPTEEDRVAWEETFGKSKETYTPTEEEIINIEKQAKRELYEEAQIIEEEKSVRLPSAKLTDEEIGTLESYSGDRFLSLNKQLREGVNLDRHDSLFVDSLDKTLEKLPTYTGTTTRHLSFNSREELENFVAGHNTGSIVNYPSYTSTSMKKEIFGEGFGGGVDLKITGRSGRDISRISENPNEKEVLFPRNTRFIVKNANRSKTEAGITRTIIELVEK